MTDLFGDNVTKPQCAGFKSRLQNAAHGFPEFWKAYPTGPRKVAKQQCLDKWAKLECAENASHIIAHVEWLKTQDDWIKDGGRYICAPLVYLNQQRWLDWVPDAPKPKRPDVLEEIKAHKGSPPPPEIRAKLAQLRGKV